MPATALPNIGLNYNWNAGENGWKAGVDFNFVVVDALLHGQIQTRTLSAPPGSPTDGQMWLVGSGATGAWAGQTGKLAIRHAGGWFFVTPRVSWRLHVIDEARDIRYNGSAWEFDFAVGAVKTITAAAYTLVAADAESVLRIDNTNPVPVTIPTNASVPFRIGTVIRLHQAGAGKATVSGAGVTINAAGGNTGTRVQHSQIVLVKVATDTWELGGDLG